MTRPTGPRLGIYALTSHSRDKRTIDPSRAWPISALPRSRHLAGNRSAEVQLVACHYGDPALELENPWRLTEPNGPFDAWP
jgi:hypothetical protein